MDALDVAELLKALEHYYHHDGSAVRIGNDATWTNQGILGIALWHNERHIRIHAECARVVDHHSTILCDVGSKLL